MNHNRERLDTIAVSAIPQEDCDVLNQYEDLA